MDGSSYLLAGFLDTEEILDLKLANHTSSEFKVWPNATDNSRLGYNSQGDRWLKNYKVDHAKEIKEIFWININLTQAVITLKVTRRRHYCCNYY